MLRYSIYIALLLLTGCAGGYRADSFCLVSRPIVYEPADVDRMSPKAVDSILRHNCALEEICGVELGIDCGD